VTAETEKAQNMLLAADIKRFLERPAEVQKGILPPDAPPGAPIGEGVMAWLAPPPLR
jgi:hypothetical protein